MSDWTAAILPLRMATSFWPSTPDAGSITRPPRRSRSKVLTDMADLLSRSPAPIGLPINCEAYFVFSYTRFRGIDSTKFMQGAVRSTARERCDGRTTRAESRYLMAAGAASRVSDPAAAPDSCRLVSGDVRRVRNHPAAI